MVYKVIGLMSGSSLDGLDIVYVHLQERAATSTQTPKSWDFQLVHTACCPYSAEWRQRLAAAPGVSALEYQLLHTEYGHFIGQQVSRFIEEFGIQYQVQLIASHGHTALHWPARKMTAQLGDGAALAAETRINVVSDLRAMDLALGGQGAPIVPIGEQMLLPGYEFFLNLGGIANVSAHRRSGSGGSFVAFDVCPANRVLNELARDEGMEYDHDGALAASGHVDHGLLKKLNALPYYGMGYPKSLANEFGTQTVLPMLREEPMLGEERLARGLATADLLRTYTEHIAEQVKRAVSELMKDGTAEAAERGAVAGTEEKAPVAEVATPPIRLLATGGGAHNHFLTSRLKALLSQLSVELVVPDAALVDYKEALIMALIGVLRWREEKNVLASVTGASRDSIGGAVWIGQEA
jgi:anhydro-N-acetylmuramic acid kinase